MLSLLHCIKPLQSPSLSLTFKSSLSSISLQLNSLLKLCTQPDKLKQTHTKLLIVGLFEHQTLLSTLTLSYISFNLLNSALLVFSSIPKPSSFLHNTLIRALSTDQNFHQSLRLYSELIASPEKNPDNFTFPFALKSSAALSAARLGKLIHAHSLLFACADDVYVNAALVDMYAKCGDVRTARKVFDGMRVRDLVSWTSMVSGYAHNGYGTETLEFFHYMRCSDVKPNRVGLLSAFLACGQLGAVRKGECFHGFAVRTGFDPDILVATAVVDMYAKCGSLDLARSMFDRTVSKDVVCWSAMIASYGYHGLGIDATGIFDRMVESGTKPNHATFTSLLSACSHSGLLREGKKYFDSMKLVYGVEPSLNHYACMVDILGRSGKLQDAKELIDKMPMEPDPSILGTLLGACRIHGDLDLGEKVADKIFEVNPNHSGYYVLLSNIYAAKSRWNDVARVRKLMAGRTVNKAQGFSLIEFDNKIYKFGVDDRSHPESKEIYSYLQVLSSRMKQLGYVPQVEFALHDVEDEMKEASLLHHSERLAIVFGLIKIKSQSPIRITKNLRVCGDCHNAIKLIAKIENRVIIMRDANRFHRFQDGICSCGDYW